DALEMNARMAVDGELKDAFVDHRKETIQHIHRVEAIFKELGMAPVLNPSQAIKGLLDDGRWSMVKMKGDIGLDMALIDVAQKAENYEISCYQTILALAKYLGLDGIVSTCETILEEEKDAKRRSRKILSRMLGQVGGERRTR